MGFVVRLLNDGINMSIELECRVNDNSQVASRVRSGEDFPCDRVNLARVGVAKVQNDGFLFINGE